MFLHSAFSTTVRVTQARLTFNPTQRSFSSLLGSGTSVFCLNKIAISGCLVLLGISQL